MQASWLTPSEIFTPFYGRAITNFILDKHSQMADPGSRLNILEIGGGTGTLARDILSHVQTAAPQTYAECSYTSVEISPQLAEVQQRAVSDTAGHGSRYQVGLGAIMTSDSPCRCLAHTLAFIRAHLSCPCPVRIQHVHFEQEFSLHGIHQQPSFAGRVPRCGGSCRVDY